MQHQVREASIGAEAFDNGVHPLGHPAVVIVHLGDLGEQFRFPVGLGGRGLDLPHPARRISRPGAQKRAN